MNKEIGCDKYNTRIYSGVNYIFLAEELSSKLSWEVWASPGCQDAVNALILVSLFSSFPSTCWAQGFIHGANLQLQATNPITTSKLPKSKQRA